MEEQLGPEVEENLFLCTPQAYMIARKRLPPHRVVKLNSLDDLSSESETPSHQPAAARIGDIVITKRFHPAVKESKAWLSPYHIDLIRELFKEGFVIEILDEQNQLLTTLGETE